MAQSGPHGRLGTARASQALADLAALPVVRAPHQPLMKHIWEILENLTTYDAAYVVLTEALDAPLLTADGPLSRSPGIGCEVRLLR